MHNWIYSCATVGSDVRKKLRIIAQKYRAVLKKRGIFYLRGAPLPKKEKKAPSLQGGGWGWVSCNYPGTEYAIPSASSSPGSIAAGYWFAPSLNMISALSHSSSSV